MAFLNSRFNNRNLPNEFGAKESQSRWAGKTQVEVISLRQRL